MSQWWPIGPVTTRRWEVLLDLSLLQSRGEGLEEMNRGREGGRHLYPESFIRLQALIRACFRLPYRQLEGFTRRLSRWEPRLVAPDHSTTCRRVNNLDIGLEPRLDPEKPVTLAVDASGIKVADRGEWLRQKWRRRRGFLKIHLAVDVETKQVVAVEVTDEGTGDGGMLKPLVEQAEGRCGVEKAITDGACDSRFNFTFLAGRGIIAAIKVRRGSSRRARGCPARRRTVLEYLRDPEAWKRRVGYGLRWMAETAFSAFKRLFGGHVMARSLPNMVREMMLKASLCSLFTRLSPSP